ncbi:MAG: zinc-ribbon domain-containing protein [Candidatus Heimdallarchaeaceae archaeon]
MARNRFLSNLIGIIVYFGTIIPIFLFARSDGYGAAVVWGGGIFGGALLLGFFAYRNDGVKIAAIIAGFIALSGIVIGILMIVGGAAFIDSINNIGDLIFGVVLGPVLIVLGIIFLVAVVVIGGISVGIAAIGSAIGEAVWKDKKGGKFTATPGQKYVPSQDAYQPASPAKPQGPASVVCKHCNASNPGGDKFCTNCGAKL